MLHKTFLNFFVDKSTGNSRELTVLLLPVLLLPDELCVDAVVLPEELVPEQVHELDDHAVGPAEARLHLVLSAAAGRARAHSVVLGKQEKAVLFSDVFGLGPKPEGPTVFLANPKKPEPDIPGPRPEICMH